MHTERFDQEGNVLIRKIPHSHWSPATKSWCIPYDNKIWQQCQTSLSQYQIIITNEPAIQQKKGMPALLDHLQLEYDRYYSHLTDTNKFRMQSPLDTLNIN